MNEPVCQYAGCGKPLVRVGWGIWICPDSHAYRVSERGQGSQFEYWPVVRDLSDMAIEINRLRGVLKVFADRKNWCDFHDMPGWDNQEIESPRRFAQEALDGGHE